MGRMRAYRGRWQRSPSSHLSDPTLGQVEAPHCTLSGARSLEYVDLAWRAAAGAQYSLPRYKGCGEVSFRKVAYVVSSVRVRGAHRVIDWVPLAQWYNRSGE